MTRDEALNLPSDVRMLRKKPVVIAAWQWNGDEESAMQIVAWIKSAGGDAMYDRVARSGSRYNTEWDYRIMITTLEGWYAAKPGDWIIRGVQGEFYPCKPDIVTSTYDEVQP